MQVGIPLAAGALLPTLGICLTPSLSGAMMGASSVLVVSNSLLLQVSGLGFAFAVQRRTGAAVQQEKDRLGECSYVFANLCLTSQHLSPSFTVGAERVAKASSDGGQHGCSTGKDEGRVKRNAVLPCFARDCDQSLSAIANNR